MLGLRSLHPQIVFSSVCTLYLPRALSGFKGSFSAPESEEAFIHISSVIYKCLISTFHCVGSYFNLRVTNTTSHQN